MRTSRLRWPAVLLCLLLSSCGAGIIAGGVFSSQSGGSSPTPSSIALSRSQGPLIARGAIAIRSAVVRGRRVPEDATAGVRLVWRGAPGGPAVDDQFLLSVVPSENETVLRFQMVTTNIQLAVPDPQAADVLVDLEVVAERSDGTTEVLFTTPFRLLRQISAELVPNEPSNARSVVSVAGGEVSLLVGAMPTRDASDITVEVSTPDREQKVLGQLLLTNRLATDVTISDAPDGRALITCRIPSNAFSSFAVLTVEHVEAGPSNPVGNVIYIPELTAVASPRGSTDGGELISVTGRGLVPIDFSTIPTALDFDSLVVRFTRGGRTVVLGADAIRPTLSSLNNLVLVTPPSPDGRAGDVSISLQATLELDFPDGRFVSLIEVTSSGLYSYGAAQTTFEPRGIGLDALPTATTFGPVTRPVAAAGGGSDAVALVPDAAGVPFVLAFEGRGNGMFSRAGLPVAAGARNDLNQRDPIELALADFDGDGRNDVFVLNAGVDASVHTWLRGVDDPGRPLASGRRAFRGERTPIGVEINRFNADQQDDVLVYGRANAHRTTTVAIPDADGKLIASRVFSSSIPLNEAAASFDADLDGHQDLLFATGSSDPVFRVLFGRGDGTFPEAVEMDLSGASAVAGASVLAIHSVRGTSNVVLLLRSNSTAEVRLLVLRPSAPREWISDSGFTRINTANQLSAWLSADLDRDGSDELVLAFDNGPLQTWRWESGQFVQVPLSANLTPEEIGQVRSLEFGKAGERPDGTEVFAVFMTHEVDLGPFREPRLSTLFVEPGPRLACPCASAPTRSPVRWLTPGLLFEDSSPNAADVVVAGDDELLVMQNDGLGTFREGRAKPVPDLVEESIITLPGAGADRVAFLDGRGRIGIMRPSGGLAFSVLSLLPAGFRVAPTSRMTADDVDHDGTIDLVILLNSSNGSDERSELVLVRGRRGEGFDFAVPGPINGRVTLPGLGASLALGDFTPNSVGPRLEVAVAIEQSSDNTGVHFFRLAESAPTHFVESTIDPADPVLASSLDPRLVLASDLDGDGFDDLVVVSASLSTLHAFRQHGARVNEHGDVDRLAFRQTSEVVLPPGLPLFAGLADVDGDRIDDVIVRVRTGNFPERHAAFVAISNAVGGYARGWVIPESRMGSGGDTIVNGVADTNGDGIPDLIVGRTAAERGTLQVLFGSHR